MSHTRQIWESYHIVNNQIKGNYAYNGGYHFMIWVIGSSASVEYSIKAWYETVIGRITDTHEVQTAEDKFNADFTQDYVDFIKDVPWYEFDFKKRLHSLWTATPWQGDHLLRKVERRYILTSELGVKWLYGKLIALGTKTVYDAALPTTAVLVDAAPQKNIAVNIIRQYSDGSALLSLPRYDQFNPVITSLAVNGFTFKEIAGNSSAILLTVLMPSKKMLSIPNTQIVFTQPIASDIMMKRIALAVPVKDLNETLLQLKKEAIRVEHIFDF